METQESNKPENPQAFPALPIKTKDGSIGLGMTLRDYFAAQALMSMLAPVQNIGGGTIFDKAAELSYKFADAMLKARQI